MVFAFLVYHRRIYLSIGDGAFLKIPRPQLKDADYSDRIGIAFSHEGIRLEKQVSNWTRVMRR